MAKTAQQRSLAARPLCLPMRPVPWRLSLAVVAVVALVAMLAGCANGPRNDTASAPKAAPSAATPSTDSPAMVPDRDGPEANPPPGLSSLPDAEPKLEPIRGGGPNKPFEAFGQAYVPITQDKPFVQRGLASWYGRKFHGRRTASGEVYNMYAMTAAHPTLPIPSYARVRNPTNGREVVVRINDRGPFHSTRIVDLSYTAALKLDVLRGVATVELERITYEDIRTGAWRRGAPAADPVPVPATAEVSTLAAVATEPVAEAVAVAAVVAQPLTAAPPATAPTVVAASTPVPMAQAPPRSSSAAARGFWVQLGAFRQREGAEGFAQRVAAAADWLTPLLAVFRDASLFRLQAGPYGNRNEARSVAERVRETLQLVPVIVERR